MGLTDAIRRIRYPRLRSRSGKDRRAFPSWVPAADLVALAALGFVLVAVVLVITQLPQTRLDFPVDRQPPQVVLRDLYGLEQNSAGAYRWSRPVASLEIPLDAPGEYRVSLVLQDAQGVPAPRQVTISLNGVPAGTFTVDQAPHPYDVTGQISLATWASAERHTMTVRWETTPYVAPSDPRPLGLILLGMAIEPVAPSAPLPPALLVPALLLLLLVYGGLRLLGMTPLWSAVLLCLLLVGGALLSISDRARTLALAYQTLSQPILTIGVALFLAPLLFATRAWRWPWRGLSPVADDVAAAGEAKLVPEGRAFRSRRSLPLVPIALVALGLRLWRFDRLSLWLDEGYTVSFVRLPWPTVLGLREQYDVHPPLYYALTKLVTTLVPEAYAGRLVSVVAGSLTVVVVYALAARLVNRRAAGVAALVIALSPVHVWYSQEARMYALSVLCVALSYLALIAATQEPTRWWIVLYGVAVLLALYSDTSALYALVPQLFWWVVWWRAERRRTIALVGAACLAGLLYLPWLLRSLATVGTAASRQGSYLDATTTKLGATALAIVGLHGGGGDANALDYWGEARTPWLAWPAARPFFVAAALIALVVGLVLLLRQTRGTAVSVAALSSATFGTAILVSLAAPGFAVRTLLYAVCSWALLFGTAWSTDGSRRLLAVASAGLGGVLLLSTLTLGTILQTGTKQGYRDLAAATAVATAADRLPILTNDDVTATLIDLYQPQALAARHDNVTAESVDAVASRYGRDPGALWFAYGDYAWLDSRAIVQQLVALGFERRSQQYFRGGLYLDLYVRPGASVAP